MFQKLMTILLRERNLVILLFLGISFIGFLCSKKVAIDAIPNIGQNQVIVFANWPGKSPKDVEDQITYPLSINLLSVPGAVSVRGKSLFGYSFVQVTFDDSLDFYWARSRVTEQLGTASNILPDGVVPNLGPDSTGLGQIFYYVLKSDQKINLAKLRSVQDYFVRYALGSVEGVTEVSSIGGFVKQYQIDVDPNKLRFHQITLDKLVNSIKKSNTEIGAGTIEQSGMEFIIRGKGYLGSEHKGKGNGVISDIENTVIISKTGVPIRVKDIGYVQNGTEFRRGALDYNGGEAVGGIVVMRSGENPEKVIQRVKEKIKSIEPSLDGIKIVPIYDRTDLINETIDTLTDALTYEVLITILVIIVFLLHIRTSLIVAISLPISVLLSFIFMYIFKIEANIMSLAGIAIAIGNMVDMGIIICENIYEKFSLKENLNEKRSKIIVSAVMEVAPAVVTATLTTVVSFLPVFFLTGRDYKLFSPLAFTKTYALLSSLFVSVFLLPILCRVFLVTKITRKKSLITIISGSVIGFFAAYLIGSQEIVFGLFGLGFGFIISLLLNWEKIKPISENPINRIILYLYKPLLILCIKSKYIFLMIPSSLLVLGLFMWLGISPVLEPLAKLLDMSGFDVESSETYISLKKTFPGLKTDDWIALDEGSFFYMPTLYPSSSFSEAFRVLQTQNTLMKSIPEVKDVLGKIGRSDSALDPAPASMIETYVMLHPKNTWRKGFSEKEIWEEINSKATLTGVTPASFLQPIEGRVVMLQSGIKASMAIRIFGDSLEKLSIAAKNVADHLKKSPYIHKNTVNPDIVLGKPYAEFSINRISAARYGMNVKDINDVIQTALGGKTVTHTIEGRERYPVRIRYLRELRDKIEYLEKIPVVTNTGQTVPLGVLAKLKTDWGPASISSENARLVAHVSFSPSGVAGAIETVDKVMASLKTSRNDNSLVLPEGYEFQAVGSFQNQVEANQRLVWLIPLVVLINILILYLGFRNLYLCFLVFSGIPVAFGGGMLLLSILDMKINTAIWVGFIALFGIAVDNGVIILSQLKNYFRKFQPSSRKEFLDGIIYCGMRRVRPCVMTTTTTLIALIPILISEGRGADVAKSMAYPIFGGMFFALMGLFIVPVLYTSQFKTFKK